LATNVKKDSGKEIMSTESTFEPQITVYELAENSALHKTYKHNSIMIPKIYNQFGYGSTVVRIEAISDEKYDGFMLHTTFQNQQAMEDSILSRGDHPIFYHVDGAIMNVFKVRTSKTTFLHFIYSLIVSINMRHKRDIIVPSPFRCSVNSIFPLRFQPCESEAKAKIS
jgi:hypothetical protein